MRCCSGRVLLGAQVQSVAVGADDGVGVGQFGDHHGLPGQDDTLVVGVPGQPPYGDGGAGVGAGRGDKYE